MQTSTPPGDSGNDLRDDVTARHGDVDKNGDLVDELTRRLAPCICGVNPSLEADQLRAVKQLIKPWGRP